MVKKAAIWTKFVVKKLIYTINPQGVFKYYFWCYHIYVTIQNGYCKQLSFNIIFQGQGASCSITYDIYVCVSYVGPNHFRAKSTGIGLKPMST